MYKEILSLSMHEYLRCTSFLSGVFYQIVGFSTNSGHISRIVVTLQASSSYQNDDKVEVKIITKKETCRSNKQNKSFESASVFLADFFT